LRARRGGRAPLRDHQKEEESDMKRQISGTFLVMVLTLVAANAHATSRLHTVHGTICQPTSTSVGSIEYTQFGTQNISTTATANVECPLPIDYQVLPVIEVLDQVQLIAYDRSTTADVSCSLRNVDVSGNVLMSLPKSTSGGGPGTGSQAVVFTPPAGTMISGIWSLVCSIPAVQSGAFSHVTTVLISSHF
jgi:hypothetical protein